MTMKKPVRKAKVTFDKMIALLNKGLEDYLQELGPKTFKNPSFVFVENRDEAA